MEDFKELQSIWNKQASATPTSGGSEIAAASHQKIKAVKAKYFWTVGLLTALIIVLLYFYSYIYHANIADRIRGLQLMIAVIISRVFLEIVSITQLKKVNATSSFKNYASKLVSFYQLRRTIHLFFTPVIYFLYCLGFISLLPLFKENVSAGFYVYLLCSGIGFLLVFSYALYKIIKKDLADLRFLKNIDKEQGELKDTQP